MKSQYRPLFAFAALMLFVSLACYGGGTPTPAQPPATDAPPATEAPTQPQVEEPSPVPTEPPVQESSAEQFFTEEFDNDISNWSRLNVTGSKDTNVDGLELEVKDSRLVFDFSTKQLYTYLFYDPFEYENVSLEVNAENRGMNDNSISLICRYSEDDGWYEFNVANSGLYNILYGFYQADGNIGYSRIADGGSNKIKSGKEVNTYKITCNDRKLALYINGTETRVIEDNQHVLRKGKIGISVSSFNQLPVKVEFDWVKISEP
ncbi:hypothetical protein ANAEL_04111 [Anaerolineales bacterium]|nr:hypothetical protein ANAEL_04111 [Anaerolineales bacterium]